MSANPLEDDSERDHRIRERAYHLWNDEGRPHGRHDEYWERARELVAMRDSAGAGQLVNPEAAGLDPSRSEPVEEAFLQENLGEFPDRLADQGEVDPTPKARRTARAAVAAPERVSDIPHAGSATAAEKLPAKPALKAKAQSAEPAAEPAPPAKQAAPATTSDKASAKPTLKPAAKKRLK